MPKTTDKRQTEKYISETNLAILIKASLKLHIPTTYNII